MPRRLMALAVALALCCTALAQDDGGGGDGGGKKKGGGGGGGKPPTYKSILKTCPVLMRIAFTDEQKTKIAELEGKVQAEFDQAVTDAGDDKAKLKELRGKLVEFHDKLRAEIVALLDEEQKKKYDAGMALIEEYKAKMAEATKAKDRAKAKELKGELETKLNEVVGPKASGGGGGKPKAPKKKKTDDGGGEGGGGEGGGDQNAPQF